MIERKTFVATVIGIALGVSSLGAGLLLAAAPQPIAPLTGAAWAWAVGAGSVLWALPWVEQAFGVEEVLEQ